MRQYRRLLLLPGALAATIPSAMARLAATMIGLALLLAMVSQGWDYAMGAGATAAYIAGIAVGAPGWGRLADRTGPSRSFVVGGLLAAIPLSTLALAGGELPAAAIIILALSGGLLAPPVGASMRAMWSRLTADPQLLAASYAWEATLSELLFIIGPAAVGGLMWLGGARSALLVSLALLVIGTIGFGLSGKVRSTPPAHGPDQAGGGTRERLYGSAAMMVLAAIALTAAMSSALAVVITAYISRDGTPSSWVGPILALESAGSVFGGLWYGSRTWHNEPIRRFLWLLLALGVGSAGLPIVALTADWPSLGTSGLWMVALMVLLGGVPIALVGTEEFALIGRLSPQTRRTQAFAGVGSVIAIGGALGTFAAGLAADAFTVRLTLFVPVFCVALAFVIIAAGGGLLRAEMTRRERISS